MFLVAWLKSMQWEMNQGTFDGYVEDENIPNSDIPDSDI
ncbi:hypothetical protein HMPREF1508_0009 [Shuttleworthella sp. MSX8B]|nr:hypothetical protein HMPREF1508_0009 [Shuttleworthia sp. MSX8B]EUC88645.1 hypothetical protein HMPREF1569_0253 [Klebsiella oxytoca OK-1]